MDVRVLLLSPLNKRSGNLATIQRIRHELEAGGLDCVLSGPDHPPGGGDWNDYIRDAGISVAVGIHAFKCGIVLKDLSCPYILIVGGTDVNGAPENGCQEDVMTQAVRGAGGRSFTEVDIPYKTLYSGKRLINPSTLSTKPTSGDDEV
ncbi:GL1D1-like protein [Mya arenaria]|uniref:GL1D1-like protein n=1 Tax=Mya arenaria TaxID=6604 RepID=A0ABY7E2T2_MYAAR|nr:GL1D1-like protein [Mya arenaria]